jgi:hypothetical protein
VCNKARENGAKKVTIRYETDRGPSVILFNQQKSLPYTISYTLYTKSEEIHLLNMQKNVKTFYQNVERIKNSYMTLSKYILLSPAYFLQLSLGLFVHSCKDPIVLIYITCDNHYNIFRAKILWNFQTIPWSSEQI